jgi:hypothetical protein
MQKYNLSNLDDFEQFTIEKMNALSQELKMKEIKILDIERKLKALEETQRKIEDLEEET